MSKGVSRSDRVTALQVLHRCIAEYCVWEASYSRDALDSLRRDILKSPAPPTHLGLTGTSNSDSDFGEFVFHDFDEDSTERLEPADVYVGEEFLPHPVYEICTPAARNIMVGEDPDQMPYVPFADDPTFNFEPYNDEHDNFAWQQLGLDPALGIIAIEAMQRLMAKGIDPANVDEMGVFPSHLSTGSAPAYARLGRLLHRRDFPETLPPGWKHILQNIPAYHKAGPSSLLTSLLNTFCHNPSCLTGYCSVHLERIPPPLVQTPSISSASLAASAEKACGDDCFLISLTLRDINSAETSWSETDKELLKAVLDHSPDALPCDLAVICRKPCSEVFKYRAEHFEATQPPRKRAAGGEMVFIDHDAQRFKPKKPCSHSGPCDASSECKCFKNSVHCTPNCRCNRKCVRQWPGCDCGLRPGQVCLANPRKKKKKCPCRRALRECDPRICHGCSVSRVIAPTKTSSQQKTATVCCNMAIQLGLVKRTEVRRSRWGLGLFIMEDAEEDGFILEYTGELVRDATIESREHIASHRGRSYPYNLNLKLSVDSSVVGNETRYINHDATDFNCQATICNVLGEHRIGIFATKFIAKGSELLINYGSGFFKDDMGTGQHASTGTATQATPRRKGLSVGEGLDRPIKEEDLSDMSYQPSLSYSRSGSPGSTLDS